MNVISADLGQSKDPTAIVVWTEKKKWGEKTNIPGTPQHDAEERTIVTEWHCRFIERPPLGTSYVRIVERLRDMVEALPGVTHLLLDATGVGRPVIDLAREAGLSPVGITISGGHAITENDMGFVVPKRDLVSALLTMYQTTSIRVAASLELAPVLSRELQHFTAKITQNARDTYEAWCDGEHDDIVLAMAMAAWYVRRYFPAVESSTPKKSEYPKYDPFSDYRGP